MYVRKRKKWGLKGRERDSRNEFQKRGKHENLREEPKRVSLNRNLTYELCEKS